MTRRGHAELAQPGAERDAALAAADDQDVGLGRVAELARLPLALLLPGLAVLVRAVLGAHRPVRPRRLLVALELVERGEQRPGLAVASAAAARVRGRPPVSNAIHASVTPSASPGSSPVAIRKSLGRTARAWRPAGRRPRSALDGLDVPGERDEVAPVALVGEQFCGSRHVASRHRVLELRQPRRDCRCRLSLVHGCRHLRTPVVVDDRNGVLRQA